MKDIIQKIMSAWVEDESDKVETFLGKDFFFGLNFFFREGSVHSRMMTKPIQNESIFATDPKKMFVLI